jgi:hypothetical protein
MRAKAELLHPKRKYDVFARRAAGDALAMIGSVYAPDDALARVYAFTTYNEDPWYEVLIAPHDAFLLVSHAEVLTTGEER